MTAMLAALGIVGALISSAIWFGATADWGPPGTVQYDAYALMNRLTGLALALMVAAPLSLWRSLRGDEDAAGACRGLLVLTMALFGMVVGSVAEFWFFNDQPYQGPGSEGRNIAWFTFLCSALVVAGGSIVTGLLLVRRSLVARWAGVAITAAAPIGIVASVLGAPLFIAVPLVALTLGVATLATGRSQPVAPRTA